MAAVTAPLPHGRGAPSVIPRKGRSWWNSYAASLAQFAILITALAWVIAQGAAQIDYSWQWYRVPQYLLRDVDGEIIVGPLLLGLMVTLEITWWSMLLATALGLATALLRLSQSVVARGFARCYLELIRNTPLLVQLYVFYFILAPIFHLDRYLTGILTLAIFEGAYVSEIFRAGILAVGRGQWDAAGSLGLTKAQGYRLVVLPQATRIILPPLGNQAISLLKASAMVSVIAVFDLTTEGRNIISDTFMTFEIWITVAVMYLAVTMVMSSGVMALERRLKPME